MKKNEDRAMAMLKHCSWLFLGVLMITTEMFASGCKGKNPEAESKAEETATQTQTEQTQQVTIYGNAAIPAYI